MTKKDNSTSPVTIAKLFDWRKGDPVLIPPHFVKELMKDVGETSAILLFTPETKHLRIIPTTSEKVVQIVIFMSDLQCSKDSSVCVKVGRFIAQEGFTILHSTSLTYLQTPCEYCLYIDPPSRKYSWEDFKERVERLKGVLEVKISPIQAI